MSLGMEFRPTFKSIDDQVNFNAEDTEVFAKGRRVNASLPHLIRDTRLPSQGQSWPDAL